MQLISKRALPALLALGACGSSGEMARPMRDASDAVAQEPGPDGQVKPSTDAASDAASESGEDAPDAALSDPGQQLAHFVYVGGWKDGDYPYRTYGVDQATRVLARVGPEANLGNNPSYAIGSRDGRHLYVANESWSGQPSLAVAAIGLDGAAVPLQAFPLPGSGSPVFTSLTPNGRFLLVADIRVGQVVVVSIDDGRLVAVTDSALVPAGAAPSAETHSVVVHPSGKWAYAANKAIDQIAQYALDEGTGKLTPLSPPLVAGEDEPRVVAIHPNGTLAYVMHEKGNVLVAYRIGASGALTRLTGSAAVTPTLPSSFSGSSIGAHVVVHPSGKYLYASNRGHDSIAAYAIAADGSLTLLGHTPSGGKGPRHFDVDVRGELLVVANQGTGNDGTLVAFAIGSDGKLSAPGPAIAGITQPTSATIISRAAP